MKKINGYIAENKVRRISVPKTCAGNLVITLNPEIQPIYNLKILQDFSDYEIFQKVVREIFSKIDYLKTYDEDVCTYYSRKVGVAYVLEIWLSDLSCKIAEYIWIPNSRIQNGL